ncbi:MAG TPA: chemotaxis protein CheW, partial [Myxococcota bacterium]|nr:chemotaxis protein CheW [Myxococcota bacterium]
MSTSAATLRRDFDRSFAEPLPARSSGDVELLAVRVAGEPYLLPLRELAGLVADARVVGVPSALAEFLGVVGIRGVVVPVYDLGAILRQVSARRARWIALTARGRIGLAFDAFDGQRRVPSGELHAAA